MPVMDPFAGAQQENNDNQKALLDAIAQGGAAGKKAYEDAQAEVARTRQDALGRATQRAQLTGQNLGGADTARVQDTSDRYTNYMGAQNAAFQNNLQGISASGQSYLAKVNAILPFVQNQNVQAANDREAQIKAAIATAQAKADADAAAAAQKAKDEWDRLVYTQQQENARAGSKAQASNAPTANALIGQANQLLPQAQKAVGALPTIQTTPQVISGGKSLGTGFAGMAPGNNLNQQAANILSRGGPAVPADVYNLSNMSLQDIAAKLGVQQGASANTINSLYTPQQMASVATAIKKNEPPPPPDVKSAAKVLGGDTKTAQTILDSQRYKDANAAVGDFLNEPTDEKGKLTNPDYAGLSPYDAYIQYVTAALIDPTKYTRTLQVLGAQMRPLFASLGKT